MNAKIKFQQTAAKKNLKAGYSGENKTMFVSGPDAEVKSFIRICNLKGKGTYPFKVAQG